MPDDSRMGRFERNAQRFAARDAVLVVLVAAFVLLLVKGTSLEAAGEQLGPGPQRDVVLAVGHPARWVADKLPLHTAADRLTASLSPDAALGGARGFATPGTAADAGTVPVVTPDAFDPRAIGAPAPRRAMLHTVLVTGDSLSTPLDLEVARRLAGRGVKVLRDPHLGTGISKTALVDWGKLSTQQTRNDRADAVIVFIGANEGFPMRGPSGAPVACCGAAWAAIYANRARQMMNTYRRGGRTRVYWITVPTAREAARAKIGRVVNAAVEVAAQPWRDQVSIVDTVPIFTPGARYRDAMPVGGRQTIVRESDGIHLNEAGAGLLAQRMVALLGRDFRP